MKKICAVIVSILCLSWFTAAKMQQTSATAINWMTDFEQATGQAKRESKPLFLYFTGSDWCPWCIQMDKEILSTPEFQEALAEKLIFVKIDFPKNEILHEKQIGQNERLAKEYNVKGFPTVILLDPNLKQIATLYYNGDTGAGFAKLVLKTLETANGKSPSPAP